MKRQLFKELKVLLAIVFIISLILPFVYSSVVESFSGTYQYYLPITITDTSNTTRNNVPALLSINGTTYYAASYINSSGTNTAMTDNSTGADVEYSMGDRTGSLIPTLPAGGSVAYRLLLGTSTNQTRFPVITGTGGYITTVDNSALENADNITISGIFDTSASEVGSNVTYKQDALVAYVDSVGSVTANITGSTDRPDRDDNAVGWTNTAYAYDDNIATSANVSVAQGTSSNFTLMSFNDGAYVSSIQVYSSATEGNDQIDVDLQSNPSGVFNALESSVTLNVTSSERVLNVSANVVAVLSIDTSANTTSIYTYAVSSTGSFTLIDSLANPTINGFNPYNAQIVHASGNIYALLYNSYAGIDCKYAVWTTSIDSAGNIGGVINQLTIDSLNNNYTTFWMDIIHVTGNYYLAGYAPQGYGAILLRTITIDGSGNCALVDTKNIAVTGASYWLRMLMLENSTSNIVMIKYFGSSANYVQTYPISSSGTIGGVIDSQTFTQIFGNDGGLAHIWNNVYAMGRGENFSTFTVSSAGIINVSFIDTQNVSGFASENNINIYHLYGTYYAVTYDEHSANNYRVAIYTISTTGDISNAAISDGLLVLGSGSYYPVGMAHVLDDEYVVGLYVTGTGYYKSISINQGSWGDIYTGSHAGGWASYTVSPTTIATNIRVRYTNAVDGGSNPMENALYEVKVMNGASVTAPVSSSRHKLALGIVGTTLTMYVDGAGIDTDSCYGIADTAYDWVWTRGVNGTSVMPLVDNITMGVGGSEVIKYAPNSMITGDTLVNRDSGGSYPGTIHWGTNSNLSITYGTPTAIPSVRTDGASNVQPTQATLYGTLMSLGGEPSMFVGFEYGQTTSYGSNTTLEGMNAVGYFAPTTISGLLPNTTYHFRALGLYSDGVVYGADMSFTTLSGTGATTDIDIVKAGVFNSYVSTNDTLFVLEMNIAYAPYFPTKDPAKYFQLQLLSTDNSTILGASPIVQWGDRPESIYLSSASSAPLTYQAPYILRVISIDSSFSTNATYTLVPRDWYGTDPEQIDRWCIFAAYRMEVTDNTSLYLQTLTDRRTIITEYAGGYFTEGIPGIAQVRPDLFSVAERKNRVPTLSSATNYNSGNTTVAGRIGATMANDANTVGAILGLNGQQLLLFMILFTIIGAMLLVTSKTGGWGALGAICLSVPLIGASIYFNIVAIGMFTVFAVVMIILWVRQFWWKTI